MMELEQIRTEVLDREAVLRRYGTIRQIKKSAQNILPKCQMLLIVMVHTVESEDAQNLERIASLVVDTLANLSPPAALDLSLRLERQGRSGMLNETAQTIKQLETELSQLEHTIANLR